MNVGSDLRWEGFDTRTGISDRLRADLAAAVDESFSLDGWGSKCDSTTTNAEEGNTSQALSWTAEQILDNAKKRLTVVSHPKHLTLVLICFLEYGR